MDDQRVGAVFRALRRRRGLRQRDIAERAGVGQSTVSRIERGHVDEHQLRAVRAVASVVDMRVELNVRWRGAELDRVLDEDHARLAGAVAEILAALNWDVLSEVTYSMYGERGSIDLLAAHRATRMAVVIEIKAQLVSVESMGRKLDEKVRLAPRIVLERFGFRPIAVGRIVVLPDASTERRRVQSHRSLLSRMLPSGGRAVRAWLRAPIGALAGLWFLSLSHPRTGKRIGAAPERVRRRL
jgi:transcriptional regulator with XRE-family HTH domain